MAFGTPTTLTNEESTSSADSYTTVSISPTANALILVVANLGDNSNGAESITVSDSFSGGIGSWTNEIALPHSSDVTAIFVSYAIAGSSPGSGTITVTPNQTAIARWVIWVGEIDGGFNTSDPIAQSKSEEETRAATESITLDSSITSGNAVFAAIALRDEDAGVTPGTDFSEPTNGDFGNGTGTNDWWLQVEYDLTPADGTADWSDIDANGKDCLTAVLEIAAEAGHPDLEAATGSYSITGQNPGITAARKLVQAAAGSYAISGQTTGIAAQRKLAADAGSYTITGQDVTFTRTYALACDAGSYAVTGQDPTLQVNHPLAADAGSYAVTGQDPALTADRALVCTAGTYTITGLDATLTYSGEGAYELTCDAGSYAISGQDPALVVGRKIAPDAGSYAISGQDPVLAIARQLATNAGSYVITGLDATLTYTPVGGYEITLDVGSYTITGQAVTLAVARQLAPDAGSYAITGQTTALSRGAALILEVGSYTVTGQDVTLVTARALAVATGAYTLTGQETALDYSGFAAQIYAVDLFVNLLPSLVLACNLTPTESKHANPSPAEEVNIG